ncbi:MAG TPA: Hpt domain-containing protein [Burkholderiaceae bacterium]
MSQTIIDMQVFRELQDSAGADFVSELLDTFFEEAPQLLAQLQHAFESGDADAFRRTAHSLKTNAMTFGATHMAQTARALELGGLAAPAALAAEYQGVAAALAQLR